MQVILRDQMENPALVLDLPDVSKDQARWLLGVAELQCQGPVTFRKLVKHIGQLSPNDSMVNRLIRKGWLTISRRHAGTIRLARELVWREVVGCNGNQINQGDFHGVASDSFDGHGSNPR